MTRRRTASVDRTARRITLLALLVTTAACSSPRAEAGSEAADITSVPTRITLERGACQGTCPVYSVAIDDAGAIRYEGVAHVARAGAASASVPARAARELAEEFVRAGFFDLKERYTGDRPECAPFIADLPHIHLELRLGERVKSVMADGGCAQLPQVVLDLGRRVDEVASSARWTRHP